MSVAPLAHAANRKCLFFHFSGLFPCNGVGGTGRPGGGDGEKVEVDGAQGGSEWKPVCQQ